MNPRRFRSFSLRTLLLLVAICAAFCGWLAVERRTVLERQAALAAWSSAPTFVRVTTFKQAHTNWNNGRTIRSAAGLQIPPVQPKLIAIPWHRSLLGDEAIHRISFRGADEATLLRASQTFPEARITNDGVRISDSK